MSQTKLTLDSLEVETFAAGDIPTDALASADTYATTGGPYLCAVDCGSDGCRTNLC